MLKCRGRLCPALFPRLTAAPVFGIMPNMSQTGSRSAALLVTMVLTACAQTQAATPDAKAAEKAPTAAQPAATQGKAANPAIDKVLGKGSWYVGSVNPHDVYFFPCLPQAFGTGDYSLGADEIRFVGESKPVVFYGDAHPNNPIAVHGPGMEAHFVPTGGVDVDAEAAKK
jgi:hypothetical protein